MFEISVNQFFNELNNVQPGHFYLWAGEEKFLKKEGIKKLKEKLNLDVMNFSQYHANHKDINEIILEALTPPILKDFRVIVIDSVETMSSSSMEKLIEYIRKPSATTVLILTTEAKTNKNSQLYQEAENNGILITFRPLTHEQVINWVNSEIQSRSKKISMQAIETMIELIGTNMFAVQKETEKLLLYCHDKKFIDEVDIINSVGYSKQQNPFEFTKSIYEKNRKNAVKLLNELLKEGMEPMRILYNISATLRKILKVKTMSESGISDENIRSYLGISRNYYGNILRSAKIYTSENLIKSLQMCIKIESIFKSSTGRNPSILLKQLLYETFSV